MLPEVELATGALTLGRTDLVLPAPGMDVVLGRDYSSAGIRYGLFGWGSGARRPRPPTAESRRHRRPVCLFGGPVCFWEALERASGPGYHLIRQRRQYPDGVGVPR